MNMFKRGRKVKDEIDPFEALAVANGPPKVKHGKITKRKGKHVMEEKPVFTLDDALPQSDDFRTSLIMPGLSARFSMLREQDNPHSKIGKAADDSVLFPKRASRLNLFGHNQYALADIAEVESIRSSFKPPFADRERASSFGDGYDSDNGSVMSRSRPGEGNNLFGGRQKLYRIPTTSMRNLNEPESQSMVGKHMYESDVSLSHFQQYRQREKEVRRSNEETCINLSNEADDSDAVHSPTLGHHEFSQKRGTQSSTASAASNIRSSTAATSVASDSPNLQLGHSQSGGDSFTATSPSLRKFREEPNKPSRQLSQSKSAANMREKFRPAGIYSANALRSASPASAGAVQPLDFGFGEVKNGFKLNRQANAFTHPTSKDAHSVLASNVHANDRGKATALGLFNKPAKDFDEQQYLQRQLQMHEGRNSPLQTSSRSQSRASSEAQRTHPSAIRATPSPAPSDITNTSTQIPPLPNRSGTPQRNGERASKGSTSSPGRQTPPTRPRSKSSASATAKDNVKARVESLIRRQNAELALLESEKLGTSRTQDTSEPQRQSNEIRSTFLDEEDDESSVRESQSSAMRLPDGDVHPAFRTSFATSSTSSHFPRSQTLADDNHDDDDNSRSHTSGAGSDQSALQSNLGLSGMIRSHLRHDSDKSVGITTTLGHSISKDPETAMGHPSGSQPRFDASRLDPGNPISGPPTPTTAMSQRAQMMLSQAHALQSGALTAKSSREIDDDASDYGDENELHQPTSSTHQRGDSSATTKERREFDEELAKRRRMIREGLKSVVERDQSESPVSPRGREHTMQAFAQPGDTYQTEPELRNQRDHHPRVEQERRLDSSAKSSAEYHDSRPNSDRNLADSSAASSQYRSPTSGSGYRDRSGSRSITPPSNHYQRGRSNSAAADRLRGNPSHRPGPSPPLPNLYSPTSTRSPIKYYEQPNSPREFRARATPTTDQRSNMASPPPLSDINVNNLRQAPTSSTSPFVDQNVQAQYQYSSGRATPTSASRSTSQSGRKRSGTKTQISEPTFISSTSSIPLIPLPQGLGSQSPPPLPEMNPRRRVNNGPDKQFPSLNINLSNALRLPLETVPASPRFPDQESRQSSDNISTARPRPKLRKSSSEGGNLASTARQQAIYAELQREKAISPGLPNRSATALGLAQDGGMF